VLIRAKDEGCHGNNGNIPRWDLCQYKCDLSPTSFEAVGKVKLSHVIGKKMHFVRFVAIHGSILVVNVLNINNYSEMERGSQLNCS